MTQPPQPPNQPPQGGFGAPQNPPPGGFGQPAEPGYGYPQAPQPPQTPPPAAPPAAPQTPPPPPQGQPGQPNYGYPQAPGAPGTPPPAAPGTPPPAYAQPTQAAFPAVGQPQQPGYGYPGQPGQPGQQPGYGYPGQPTMPMQPQPGGGGGKKPNKQMTIIVAAVAAIALIVGGGVWYASTQKDDDKNNSAGDGKGKDGKGKGGDENGPPAAGGPAKEKVPANTSAKVGFQVPAPAVPKDDIWSVAGSWLTDDTYVKSGFVGKDAKDKDHALVGYDPASGKEKWTIPLAGETCAVSKEVTKEGIAAVVSKDAKSTKANKYPDCSEVSAVDLKSGKKLWTENVEVSGSKVEFEEITIAGDTIAAGAGTGGTGAAWNMSGKLLWKPSIGDKCKDAGYAGGDQLVAVRKCGNYDDAKLKIQLLDPKTGKEKWSYPLAAGVDNAKIISTNPVVFGQDTEEITASGATDVFSLSNNGKLRARIKLEDGKYAHDCEVNKWASCSAIVVGNDKLYVPTRQHDAGGSDYGFTNEIIGFSLATGKTTGDRADAGKDGEMFPLRMDGGNLLAYKGGGYNKGAKVVSLDGKSMKETTLLETPATESVSSAISGMVPKSNELLYTNGNLFMGKKLISKPYSKDDKEYIALGFTTQ